MRGSLDATTATPKQSSLCEVVAFITQQRAVIHLLIGGSVATFWSWGSMWWTPTFLVRSHGMSVGEAGSVLGQMHLVAGIIGTLVAGGLMARRASGHPQYGRGCSRGSPR